MVYILLWQLLVNTHLSYLSLSLYLSLSVHCTLVLFRVVCAIQKVQDERERERELALVPLPYVLILYCTIIVIRQSF